MYKKMNLKLVCCYFIFLICINTSSLLVSSITKNHQLEIETVRDNKGCRDIRTLNTQFIRTESSFRDEDRELISKKTALSNSPTNLHLESENIDPFYYLDNGLEDYYQLAECHGFVGNKFNPTIGGTLTGFTGKILRFA